MTTRLEPRDHPLKARLEGAAKMFEEMGLAGHSSIYSAAAKEIQRLYEICDMLSREPMTIEEAEAAFDDLPELTDEEKAMCDSIDFDQILKAATDPANKSAFGVACDLLAEAKKCPGFNPEMIASVESWINKQMGGS